MKVKEKKGEDKYCYLLNDFACWLWDIGRLKVNAQLPPFETPEKIVEYYYKTNMFNFKINLKMEKQTELRMTKDVSSTEYISKNEEFVLNRKIEIPENSHFNVYESGTKKEYFCENVELLIGIGKDHTASLVMDKEAFDALQSGEQLTIL